MKPGREGLVSYLSSGSLGGAVSTQRGQSGPVEGTQFLNSPQSVGADPFQKAEV